MRLAARKQWLAGHLQPRGRLTLDAGAVRALREQGKSLLAVGVKGVHGTFRRGEVVVIDVRPPDVMRYFLQPSLGITSKIIDFGISTRLALVSMKQAESSITELMIEPALTLKVGWDHIKIVAQAGVSAPVSSAVTFNYQPFMISLGLQGNFGKVFQ